MDQKDNYFEQRPDALSCFTSLAKLWDFDSAQSVHLYMEHCICHHIQGRCFHDVDTTEANVWIRAVADEKWSGMRAGFGPWGFISIALPGTWQLIHNVNSP